MEELRSLIADAWNGVYDDSFNEKLNAHKESLLKPMEKGPDDASREAVKSKRVKLEKGKEVLLRDHHVDFMLNLSTRLNLNERACVQLFYEAHELVKRRHPDAIWSPRLREYIEAAIFSIYFRRRHALLLALLDLVHMYRADDAFPLHLVQTVNQFITDLLALGLAANLRTLAKNLHAVRSRATDSLTRHSVDQELWLVLQILFVLHRKYDPSAEDVKGIIELLKECCVQLAAPGNNDSELLFVCHTYTVILMAAFLAKAESIEDALGAAAAAAAASSSGTSGMGLGGMSGSLRAAPQPFAPSALKLEDGTYTKDLKELSPLITDAAAWKNESIHALVKLSWVTLLRTVRPFLPKIEEDVALSKMADEALDPRVGVFVALERDYLESQRLSDEPKIAPLLCEQLGLWLSALIATQHRELQHMRAEEEGKISPYDTQARSLEELPRTNFGALLAIIAHLCSRAPSVVGVFWSNRQFTETLLKGGTGLSNISLDTPLLPAYVKLLEALCLHSEQGCRHVFELLSQSSRLNWETIFSGFNYVLSHFLPKQQQPQQNLYPALYGPTRPSPAPQQMPGPDPKTVSKIKCMLRLVGAVARSPKVLDVIMRDDFLSFLPHAHVRRSTLDLLFSLLGCVKFPPSLKGLVLETLATFVQGRPPLAADLWSRMHAAGMVPLPAPAADPSSMGLFPAAAAGLSRDAAAAAEAAKEDRKAAGPQGLLYDLEEVEGRQLDFPLTLAFTRLIVTLLYAGPHPQGSLEAGAPVRPLLAPYVDFIKQHVFLKLDDRRYKFPAQRWALAEACFALFAKLLKDLEPLRPGAETADSPGFQLALDLLSASDVLRRTLSLVSNAASRLLESRAGRDGDAAGGASGAELERDDERGGTAETEATVLFAFKFLHEALTKEEGVLTRVHAERLPVMVRPLWEALRERGGEIVQTARLIAYSQEHLETALQALVRKHEQSFLWRAQASPSLPGGGALADMSIFGDASVGNGSVSGSGMGNGSGSGVSVELEPDTAEIAYHATAILMAIAAHDGSLVMTMFQQHGADVEICEALAAQLHNTPVPALFDQGDPALEQAALKAFELGNRARIAIFELILGQLGSAGPNEVTLGHLLLGFDVEGGAAGVAYTDLNTSERRQVLDTALELAKKPRFAAQFPAVAECCYQLFYQLLSQPLTSRPFLAFLRRDEGVLLDLLQSLPRTTGDRYQAAQLLQRSWLLRCLALQLHITVQERGGEDFVLHALEWLGLVRGASSESVASSLRAPTAGAAFGSSRLLAGGASSVPEQARSRVLEMLDGLAIESEDLPAADGHDLKESDLLPFARFRVYTSPTSYHYDVRQLATALLAAADKPGFDRTVERARVQQVCQAALRWNDRTALQEACRDAVDGWRQTVEICLLECIRTKAGDSEGVDEGILFELLIDLLQKLNQPDKWVHVSEQLAMVSLVVLAQLRLHTKITDGQGATQHVHLLQSMLGAILKSETPAATRVHLYGLMSSYLLYTKDLNAPNVTVFTNLEYDVDRRARLADYTERYRKLENSNLAALRHFGAAPVQRLCRDAESGPTRQRTMALVCLTTLLPSLAWVEQHAGTQAAPLSQLTRTLVQWLRDKDAAIMEAARSTHLRNYDLILLYEATMGLLTKVAEAWQSGGRDGTSLLLSDGLVEALTTARCFAVPPGNGSAAAASPFDPHSPPPLQRYYQLLVPALRLLVAMLTVTSGKRDLHLKALEFVVQHHDLFLRLFEEEPRYMGALQDSALRAVELATALLVLLHTGPLAHQLIAPLHESKAAEGPVAVAESTRRTRLLCDSVLRLLARLAPSFGGAAEAGMAGGGGGGGGGIADALPRSLMGGAAIGGGGERKRGGAVEESRLRLDGDGLAASGPAGGAAPGVAAMDVGDGAPAAGAAGSRELSDAVDSICRNATALLLAFSGSTLRGRAGRDAATGRDAPLVLFRLDFQETAGQGSQWQPSMRVLVVLLERACQRAASSAQEQRAAKEALDGFNTLTTAELQRLRIDLRDVPHEATRRSVAYSELRQRLDRIRAETRRCFFVIETALQLLYQHMEESLSGSGGSSASSSRFPLYPGLAGLGMRGADGGGRNADFKAGCDLLKPVLERLQHLLLSCQPTDAAMAAAAGAGAGVAVLQAPVPSAPPAGEASYALALTTRNLSLAMTHSLALPGSTSQFIATLIRRLKALL